MLIQALLNCPYCRQYKSRVEMESAMRPATCAYYSLPQGKAVIELCYMSRWVAFITSIHKSTPAVFYQDHRRCQNIPVSLMTIASYHGSLGYSWAQFQYWSDHHGLAEMALLAVAGLPCMSALLNGAETTESASSSLLLNKTAEPVSASNSWKWIDTLRTSCCWTSRKSTSFHS
jgi:hypothetical protein